MAQRASGARILRRMDPLLGTASAAMLGLASAFFCLAVPPRTIAPLLHLLGLPPAVESHIGLSLLVGLLASGVTWGGFRRLDRPRAASRPQTLLANHSAPVLRKADAHPDAPARRPIFAGSDLGTPLHLIPPLSDEGRDTEPASTANEAASVPAATEWADDADLADAPNEPPVVSPTRAEEPIGRDAQPVPAAHENAVLPAQVETIAAGDAMPSSGNETSDGDVPFVIAEPDRADPPAAGGTMSPLAIGQMPVEPQPSLTALMSRLELALARKALALRGGDSNVTPLKREIRPVSGPLLDAVELLQRRVSASRA